MGSRAEWDSEAGLGYDQADSIIRSISGGESNVIKNSCQAPMREPQYRPLGFCSKARSSVAEKESSLVK